LVYTATDKLHSYYVVYVSSSKGNKVTETEGTKKSNRPMHIFLKVYWHCLPKNIKISWSYSRS